MTFGKKYGPYGSHRIIDVPAADIRPNPMQPRRRFDPAALTRLAESIQQHGLIQPLSVRRRGRQFELIAGERRLRACQMAGLSTVPCIVLDVSSCQSSLLALVENIQRQDLDFVEEALSIRKLIDTYNLSQEEVAEYIGKSQSAVANKLRILKLPPYILSRARDAGLSERHARALLRVMGVSGRKADDLSHVIDYIIINHLNVAKAEEYIDRYLAEKQISGAIEQPSDKYYAEESYTPEDAGHPLEETGKDVSGEKPAKPTFILKDVRFFLNTVWRGMDIMKQSGIAAKCGKNETDTNIILTIEIPKGSS